jgi:glycosyltransferase involved in cell wall biosynthesis
MPVSVVIPVRDGERFLADAIESARSQSMTAREILVVDDGSTDGSADIARRAGARLVQQAPSGPGAARNLGVQEAIGDLVAFLDADDVMLVDRLLQQSGFLAEQPLAGGVFGRFGHLVLDPSGAWRETNGPAVDGLVPSTLMVRRAHFLRTGGFAPDLEAGELVDWVARSRAAGLELPALPVIVALRRAHDRNLTRDKARLDRSYLEVARRAIERRRQP